VHDLRNDCYFRPLLVYVGVLPRQRIVDDLVLECAKLATYLTYRDSRRKAPVKDQDLILGDGTKCHGLGGKKNEFNVVLGKNQITGEKSLLGLDVNKGWKRTDDYQAWHLVDKDFERIE